MWPVRKRRLPGGDGLADFNHQETPAAPVTGDYVDINYHGRAVEKDGADTR